MIIRMAINNCFLLQCLHKIEILDQEYHFTYSFHLWQNSDLSQIWYNIIVYLTMQFLIAGFVSLDKQVRMYLFLIVTFLSASSLAYRKTPISSFMRNKNLWIHKRFVLKNSYMLFHVYNTPQLCRSTTPSLRLWDVGMAAPSLLKEKEGSQESGFGNTTVLTLLGECPSFTMSICVQSEWSDEEKEHETEAGALLLSFEILHVLHFASVLSSSCSIQLRYGYIWSKVVGNIHGRSMVEMELFDDERFTQVSALQIANYKLY